MSKIPNLPDRTAGAIDNTYFDRQWSYLVPVINGGINFPDNFGATVWSGNTGPADTDFTVPHSLKRIPTGYLVLSIDLPGVVYKGSAAWNNSSITLRCNTANTNVVLVVL